MLILFCVCVCVCVDPTEESLPRLTTHFQQVLNAMVDSRWTHYPPPQRHRGGATRFTFDRKKLVLDSNPSRFLLQALALRRRFREATDTLVAAIRRFDFALYSPLLSNLFGPEIVADEGSGVEALFPPKPAGRPKKPRLDAKLLDGKSIRISDILSEALDGKTKAIYVLVCEQAKDAQWISGLLQGSGGRCAFPTLICQQNSLLPLSQESQRNKSGF